MEVVGHAKQNKICIGVIEHETNAMKCNSAQISTKLRNCFLGFLFWCGRYGHGSPIGRSSKWFYYSTTTLLTLLLHKLGCVVPYDPCDGLPRRYVQNAAAYTCVTL